MKLVERTRLLALGVYGHQSGLETMPRRSAPSMQSQSMHAYSRCAHVSHNQEGHRRSMEGMQFMHTVAQAVAHMAHVTRCVCAGSPHG
jgi:hypothetical protein